MNEVLWTVPAMVEALQARVVGTMPERHFRPVDRQSVHRKRRSLFCYQGRCARWA